MRMKKAGGMFAIGAALASSAFADPQEAPSISGVWTGAYTCGQGVTALRLSISAPDEGQIAATFDFGPLEVNVGVPKGLYYMEGTFDSKTRHVTLEGVRWILAPAHYGMVGLDGQLDETGQKISGSVTRFPNCNGFELERSRAKSG